MALRPANGGSTPVPDPTILTTQQLVREIAALREILERQIAAITDKIETRLDGMDKAIALVQTVNDKQSVDTDVKVRYLRELMDQTFQLVTEKFTSVQRQFEERDVRVQQSTIAAQTAVAAALQAAKEAVGEQAKNFQLSIDKSETATTKQLESIQTSFQREVGSLGSTLADLKERITRIEAGGVGSREARVEAHSSSTFTWQIISAIVAMAGLGSAITIAILTH